jgi:hypothetical protein
MPKLPDDPFGHGPFIYRCVEDRFLLYSVGRDGIDDGGKLLSLAEHDSRQSGDLFLEAFFYAGDSTVATDQEPAPPKAVSADELIPSQNRP